MPFQLKAFNDITLSMINHAKSVTKKVTDFQPGSIARTLMEAPAVELEQFYLQVFLGLRDAIPVAVFKSFGFDLLPAAYARGWVSVSVAAPPTSAQVIQAGTIFTTADGRSYSSTQAVTWPIGTLIVNIPVVCTAVGSVGNAPAGAITGSPAFNAPFYTINNSVIQFGRDAETDSEREARFAEFVGSLSRGTVAACSYAVKQARITDTYSNTTEYVTRLGIDEYPGEVGLYLRSSAGVPSEALLDLAQEIIDGSIDAETGNITPGYRSGGIPMSALPMVTRAVPISLGVKMLPGYTLTTAVRQSISDLYASQLEAIMPGTTAYLGTVIDGLLPVPGVEKIVPATAENITCAANEALVAGTITFSTL